MVHYSVLFYFRPTIVHPQTINSIEKTFSRVPFINSYRKRLTVRKSNTESAQKAQLTMMNGYKRTYQEKEIVDAPLTHVNFQTNEQHFVDFLFFVTFISSSVSGTQ